MKVLQLLQQIFRRNRAPVQRVNSRRRNPLREFIYLDEVSLRSLLSSQRGEMTEGVSNQSSYSEAAEFSGHSEAKLPSFASSSASSRFQTSNSSTIQTSRKATVQSWFREFHRLDDLKIVEPINTRGAFSNKEEIASIRDTSIALNCDRLKRGDLVEFRVRLQADPIFHLSTLMAEFSGMADDWPEMFAKNNHLDELKALQPVNKVLQRMLAGLIPVRAELIDYELITVSDSNFLVHSSSMATLPTEKQKVQIVGVAEHMAFWKDIRRVLFSDAEFTILARLGSKGVKQSWTPVKLAEVFKVLSPDLGEKLSSAGSLLRASKPDQHLTNKKLNVALEHYAEQLLSNAGIEVGEKGQNRLSEAIKRASAKHDSVSAHKGAFSEVYDTLQSIEPFQISPEINSDLRDEARKHANLAYFSDPLKDRETATKPETAENKSTPLLDVEFIAIYW